MIQIEKKQNCCGCTACYNICPKKAIIMLPDEEGFLYPKVDMQRCINCGLCEKVCPTLHKVDHLENTEGYILRNKDANIVKESTSGGAFTAFAEHFFKQGGVVFGTGYDDNMRVICKLASKSVDLKEMRGSKFVQSNLGTVFQNVKEKLNTGTLVLFTGTPCQIAGLIAYLGKRPSNLVCIDFVCRGVPSPELWKNYVDMMEKKYNSKMIGARFKNKTYGYHATTMKIDFKNGKTYYASGRTDPMMKAFVREMASRPSCSKCVFKGIERDSDITMFDCYEFASITGLKDDDKGYTSLLVHSETGKKLLNEISDDVECYSAAVDKLITKNGIMVCNSAKPNSLREKFYEYAMVEPLDVAMEKVSPITYKDKMIEMLKGFLFKAGIIRFIKKFKKKEIIETSGTT